MLILQSFNVARTLVKSDTVDLEQISGRNPDVIWIGGAGIVRAIMEDNQDIQFTCVAGTVLPVRMKRIMSTTTTATLFIGLWQN